MHLQIFFTKKSFLNRDIYLGIVGGDEDDKNTMYKILKEFKIYLTMMKIYCSII